MTKRSEPTNNPRRHKRIVFYLDRNLCCNEVVEPLRSAGYDLVIYWDDYGRVYNQSVEDPVIIGHCGQRKHVLITSDRRLEYTYAAEIYAAKIGVVLLVTNKGGAASWRDRLITAQPAVRRLLAEHRKPLLIRVAIDGSLTTMRLYRKGRTSSYSITEDLRLVLKG